jgi:5-(carboxyamino)imidazole ribonucleotide mutase
MKPGLYRPTGIQISWMLSSELPGVIASKTDKPVIGVPVSGTLNGLDALLAIAQMPKGVPVACVGVDNGENAAWLAIRILKLIKIA